MPEDPQPINATQLQQESPPPAPQDVDVLLDLRELEVDRIKLTVKGLRAHVSVLAELASLVSLQVGVDARLEEVDLEIEGVRAKLVLKVDLDNVRAILKHALESVAEHPEILRVLTRALEELVSGMVGDALGTLEGVLEGLEEGGTVDELLKGRLEDVRETLKDVVNQVGEQAQEAGGGLLSRRDLPGGPSSAG